MAAVAKPAKPIPARMKGLNRAEICDVNFQEFVRDWDGTPDAARRLERVLWNDPGTGVMRHADAGYEIAIDCAREQGLDLPMVVK